MKTKVIAVVIIGMMMAVAMAVAEQNKGAKAIEILGGVKGNVAFPHHTHQETLKDCNICHDVFPQVPGSIDKLKAEGKLEKKQVMNSQCINCHKEKKKQGKRQVPPRVQSVIRKKLTADIPGIRW